MELKKCFRCKLQKSKSEFYKNKSTKDGLASDCKLCCNISRKEYRNKNKEKVKGTMKKYYVNNREKRLQKDKEYREKNKEKIREYKKKKYEVNKESDNIRRKKHYQENKNASLTKNKEYREKNKEKIAEQARERYIKNKDVIMIKRREYIRKKRKNDPLFRVKDNLRGRLYATVTKGYKSASTMNLLGCDTVFFKKFIEDQFTEEMNWDNYGKVWHLDHILPCNSYDLSDPVQQKICFNYTNLRPMIAAENIRKSDKIDITDIIYGDVLVKLFKEDIEV